MGTGHTHVHSDLTRNRQTAKITQMSISRQMGTQIVAHPENGSFSLKGGGGERMLAHATTRLNWQIHRQEVDSGCQGLGEGRWR